MRRNLVCDGRRRPLACGLTTVVGELVVKDGEQPYPQIGAGPEEIYRANCPAEAVLDQIICPGESRRLCFSGYKKLGRRPIMGDVKVIGRRAAAGYVGFACFS